MYLTMGKLLFQFPARKVLVGFRLPHGIRLLSVFLTADELKQLKPTVKSLVHVDSRSHADAVSLSSAGRSISPKASMLASAASSSSNTLPCLADSSLPISEIQFISCDKNSQVKHERSNASSSRSFPRTLSGAFPNTVECGENYTRSDGVDWKIICSDGELNSCKRTYSTVPNNEEDASSVPTQQRVTVEVPAVKLQGVNICDASAGGNVSSLSECSVYMSDCEDLHKSSSGYDVGMETKETSRVTGNERSTTDDVAMETKETSGVTGNERRTIDDIATESKETIWVTGNERSATDEKPRIESHTKAEKEITKLEKSTNTGIVINYAGESVNEPECNHAVLPSVGIVIPTIAVAGQDDDTFADYAITVGQDALTFEDSNGGDGLQDDGASQVFFTEAVMQCQVSVDGFVNITSESDHQQSSQQVAGNFQSPAVTLNAPVPVEFSPCSTSKALPVGEELSLFIDKIPWPSNLLNYGKNSNNSKSCSNICDIAAGSLAKETVSSRSYRNHVIVCGQRISKLDNDQEQLSDQGNSMFYDTENNLSKHLFYDSDSAICVRKCPKNCKTKRKCRRFSFLAKGCTDSKVISSQTQWYVERNTGGTEKENFQKTDFSTVSVMPKTSSPKLLKNSVSFSGQTHLLKKATKKKRGTSEVRSNFRRVLSSDDSFPGFELSDLLMLEPSTMTNMCLYVQGVGEMALVLVLDPEECVLQVVTEDLVSNLINGLYFCVVHYSL